MALFRNATAIEMLDATEIDRLSGGTRTHTVRAIENDLAIEGDPARGTVIQRKMFDGEVEIETWIRSLDGKTLEIEFEEE